MATSVLNIYMILPITASVTVLTGLSVSILVRVDMVRHLQLQNVPTAIGSTHHANHLHVLRIRQSLTSTTLNRSAKIQSTVKNVLWYVKRVISDLQ